MGLGFKQLLVGEKRCVTTLITAAKETTTTPTHSHFVLSPVPLASRDQDGGPSDSTIDIYDLTEK